MNLRSIAHVFLVLFLVSLAGTADAEWTTACMSGRGWYSIDTDTIALKHGVARFRLLHDYTEIEDPNILSDVKYVEMDCQARTMQPLGASYFSKSHGEGSVVKATSSSEPLVYFSSGSSIEDLKNVVCNWPKPVWPQPH